MDLDFDAIPILYAAVLLIPSTTLSSFCRYFVARLLLFHCYFLDILLLSGIVAIGYPLLLFVFLPRLFLLFRASRAASADFFISSRDLRVESHPPLLSLPLPAANDAKGFAILDDYVMIQRDSD